MATRVCSRATAGNANDFASCWTIEFWSLCDGPLTVAAVSPALASYEFFFNCERPHASLDYQTPNEYLVALEAN